MNNCLNCKTKLSIADFNQHKIDLLKNGIVLTAENSRPVLCAICDKERDRHNAYISDFSDD